MKDKRLLLALILLLAAFFLLLRNEKQKQGSEGFSSYSRFSEKMKAADLQLELQKVKMEERASLMRKQAAEPFVPDLHTGRSALRLSPEAVEKQIVEDNRRKDLPGNYRTKDVDQLLLQQVSNREFAQQYDEAYKRAYIKAFLQNARDSGYDVVLNEDLEVISVEPYRGDEPMRFPNSVGPADSRADK